MVYYYLQKSNQFINDLQIFISLRLACCISALIERVSCIKQAWFAGLQGWGFFWYVACKCAPVSVASESVWICLWVGNCSFLKTATTFLLIYGCVYSLDTKNRDWMPARARVLFQPVRCFFQRDLKVVVVPAVLFSVLLPTKNVTAKHKKMRWGVVSFIGAIWLNLNILAWQ